MTETKVCGELPTFRYTWPGEDEAVIGRVN